MPSKKATTNKRPMAAKKKAAPKSTPLVKVHQGETPSRQLKQAQYRTFRLAPRIKSRAPRIPASWTILRETFRLLAANWRLFLGIIAVYLLFSFVLVKGLVLSSTVVDAKKQLEAVAGGGVTGHLLSGAALITVLAQSSGAGANATATAYQEVLLVLVSLVFIWALRQSHAGIKVGVKEAFYKGVYPLVPFLGVVFIIGVQLLPVLLASFLFGVVFAGGIAVLLIEKILWVALIFLLVVWSLYMVSASLFALYIVTLPDVGPIQALRTAHELVLHRRWSVMRKVLFLPFALLMIVFLILLPIAIFATPITEYAFFALTMSSLAIVHAYMYCLYRKMI